MNIKFEKISAKKLSLPKSKLKDLYRKSNNLLIILIITLK